MTALSTSDRSASQAAPTEPGAPPRDGVGPVAAGVAGVVFAGAIFGFFYAWVCSTMWGLDAADPRVAIEAMQAMNASVRNPVFFPAFFGTPVVLGFAAWSARRGGFPSASRWFLAASLVYLVGGLLLTMTLNVPMNEELATVTVPGSRTAAAAIWNDYSGTWQLWNTARTVFSGISLVLAGIGLARICTDKTA